MKKKNRTYVDAIKFQGLIESAMGEHEHLNVTVQSSFVKVAGNKGRAIYVAKTSAVARVDLAGFEVDLDDEAWAGVKSHSQGQFGAVSQELEFDGRSEEEILATFEAVLSHMASLQDRTVTRRKTVAGGQQAQGWGETFQGSGKKDREELIRRTAEEMGAEVSAETEAELADSLPANDEPAEELEASA
jgi:hypothetical protein